MDDIIASRLQEIANKRYVVERAVEYIAENKNDFEPEAENVDLDWLKPV